MNRTNAIQSKIGTATVVADMGGNPTVQTSWLLALTLFVRYTGSYLKIQTKLDYGFVVWPRRLGLTTTFGSAGLLQFVALPNKLLLEFFSICRWPQVDMHRISYTCETKKGKRKQFTASKSLANFRKGVVFNLDDLEFGQPQIQQQELSLVFQCPNKWGQLYIGRHLHYE